MAKRRGQHPEKALSAVQVRQLKTAGRYADGNGLYLIVDPSGAKRWVLRTIVQGKRRDIGLGGLSLVSLAEAREKALAYRKLAREGGDPLLHKRKAVPDIPTFALASEKVFEEHKHSWRNDKHAAQWITTLRTYAFPAIGSQRVDQIEAPDILKVLGPIWLTKQETARRLRQRISTVFDWAKTAGYRTGDNPVAGIAKGLPKQAGKDDHHAALAYGDVPAFVASLQNANVGEIVKLAFELLILTASRTSEVLGMKWDEVDFTNRVWTVPSERMKAKKAHRVPLTPHSVEILQRAKKIGRTEEYVFPGRSEGKSLSNTVFLMALRRMKLEATAHGFRSSFRDWAAEQTNFPREVCEMALAHTIENRVEAAYRRGDLFEKRRELMDAWATFVTSSERSGNHR
jgi:integrase